MIKKGGGSRKCGRSKKKCEKYSNARRRIKNKIKKITKWYDHIVKNRQPKNAKGIDKKPLRLLKFFTDKIGRTKEK